MGLTLGSCGVVAGILVIFLPETQGQHMPDTVQQVEERALAQKKRKTSEIISKITKEPGVNVWGWKC